MNKFIREIIGFFENNIFYTDFDSLYIEKKYWSVLDKTKLVGEKLGQSKMITKQVVSFTVHF